ncbi:MAG TPA: hypothetical protein VKS20_15010 [Candidatus Acidoferrales bacterium]|nr:hypothetical protein [Candidatus Acidoferrales bacterium]
MTGETAEQKLDHASGEAEKFYRGLRAPALIGMWNRPGNCQWFMERLAQLGHELWIGDAAKIRASESTAAARQIRQKLRSLKIRDSALQMTKQEEGARG